MQEHFNYWLEDLAQHKGAEFDSKFYRDVLSMNVHHFLRLKEELEESVSLKTRSKAHEAADVTNELQAILEILRESEVNYFCPGRTHGFEAIDDFAKGIQSLEDTTIKAFITRTVAHMDILGMQQPPEEEKLDEDADDIDQEILAPPPPLRMVDGELRLPIPVIDQHVLE